MKIFLSWSGSLSHQVACVFRDWLPAVLQYLEPYVSSEDIDKGARWSSDIAKELEQSFFGILVITRENVEAPWVAFEAGALSKMLEKSRVSPFLFNLKRSELKGPLLQFQSTIFEKEDIYKLVVSINKSASEEHRLEDGRLQHVFDVWWPELNTQLEKLLENLPDKAEKVSAKKEAQSAILEELLDLTRNQQRLLSNPEELFPPSYFEYIFRRFINLKETPELLFYGEFRERLMYLDELTHRIEMWGDEIMAKSKPVLSKSDLIEFEQLVTRLKMFVRETIMFSERSVSEKRLLRSSRK